MTTPRSKSGESTDDRLALERELRNPRATLRRRAIAELIALGDPHALPALIWLGAHDNKNRDAARDAVSRLSGGRPIPVLVEALQDDRFDVRRGTVRALGLMGQAAIEPLAMLVRDPTRRRSRRAIEALALIGAPEVVPHIEAALQDEDPQTRKKAILSLGYVGAASRNALHRALGHHDYVVRYHALVDFFDFCRGGTDSEALESVVSKLEDLHEAVRWLAARQLKRVNRQLLDGDHANRIARAIEHALQNESDSRAHDALTEALAVFK